MTNFRSRKDGSHYPISKRKSVGSFQPKTVHLSKPKKYEYRYGVQFYDSRHGVWNVLYYPKKSDAIKQAKQMNIYTKIIRMDQNGRIKDLTTIKPVENKLIQLSLKADIKDESEAGPDYRKEANQLDTAGFPIQADELRHIARQEDEHKKILTEVKKDVNQPLKIPIQKTNAINFWIDDEGWRRLREGDKVKIAEGYSHGGKTAIIKSISPSCQYFTVKVAGETRSYSGSDLRPSTEVISRERAHGRIPP